MDQTDEYLATCPEHERKYLKSISHVKTRNNHRLAIQFCKEMGLNPWEMSTKAHARALMEAANKPDLKSAHNGRPISRSTIATRLSTIKVILLYRHKMEDDLEDDFDASALLMIIEPKRDKKGERRGRDGSRITPTRGDLGSTSRNLLPVG